MKLDRTGLERAAHAILHVDNVVDRRPNRSWDTLVPTERKAYRFAATAAIRAYLFAITADRSGTPPHQTPEPRR